MIYGEVELHNAAELQTREHYPGAGLQRFPAEVRRKLGPRGRFIAEQSSGCEIRFVADSLHARVSISAYDGDGEALVFYGDLFHSRHPLKQGAVHTLHLDVPPELAGLSEAYRQGMRFAPGVWRVMTGRYHAVFHGVDAFGASCRPPRSDEVPAVRWLAYGSSITHGAHATHQANTYVEQAAARLGFQALNAGLSGACLCEREMADFLAERNDWDIATLELGVNMRDAFETEQFQERAAYLIERLFARNPDKPIAVITPYPNKESFEKHPSAAGERQLAFDRILRELAASARQAGRNVHLLEGSRILPSFAGLTRDLIHPSDYGHSLMGENLAKELGACMGANPE